MTSLRALVLAVAVGVGVAVTGAAAEEPPPILVTRQLAAARGLAAGDVVRFSAHDDGSESRPFRIVGTYEPTPDPMKLARKRHEARFHLGDLLALVAGESGGTPDAVDAIHVRLGDPDAEPTLREEIGKRAPTLAVASVAPATDAVRTFQVLERFHFAIAVITMVGSTAFLVALMVIRAEERRETIGVLRLIGLGRRRVLATVLVEGMLVALAGAAAGIVFAFLAQGSVNRFFQWYYDTALVFVRVTPTVATRCLALAVPLGVFGGVAASWTLLRRDVAALLRR